MSLARKFLLLGPLILVASALIAAEHRSKRVYANEEFGFSLEIPFYAPACEPTDGAPNTGIAFFLDMGIADCPSGFASRPYISVYFEYNAASFKDEQEQLTAVCNGAPIQKTDPKRFGKLTESWPFLCEQASGQGIVKIILAGKESRATSEDVAPVNRTAEIQSRRADISQNLEALALVLQSMKRFPRPR